MSNEQKALEHLANVLKLAAIDRKADSLLRLVEELQSKLKHNQ